MSNYCHIVIDMDEWSNALDAKRWEEEVRLMCNGLKVRAWTTSVSPEVPRGDQDTER